MQQTVKEVVQSLADDNMINAEKIGVSNYYWMFPSQALKSKESKLAALSEEAEQLASKLQGIQSEIEQENNDREENTPEAVERYLALKTLLSEQEEQFKKFKEFSLVAEKKEKA